MTGRKLGYLFFFLACVMMACDDDPDPTVDNTESYEWIESDVQLPAGAALAFRLKKFDGDKLCMVGWTEGDSTIFAKRVNDEWNILAKVAEEVIGDFAVLGDTVYYSTSRAVKKTINSLDDTLIASYEHSTLEVFEDRLIIAGNNLIWDGADNHSILAYNPGNEIVSLYKDFPGNIVGIANDRLFVVAGSELRYYKNAFLARTDRSIERNKLLLEIDHDENLYYQLDAEQQAFIMRYPRNRVAEFVGDDVSANLIGPMFELFHNSFVLAGQEIGKSSSTAFFLTSNNTWKAVPTDFVIYDLVSYDNKVLAASDGKLYELSLLHE